MGRMVIVRDDKYDGWDDQMKGLLVGLSLSSHLVAPPPRHSPR